MTSEFWQKISAAKLTRRRLLRDAVLGGSALAVGSLVGCVGGVVEDGREAPRPRPTTPNKQLPSPGQVGETPTAAATASTSPKAEASPTLELVDSERAILDLGNWEVAIVGWDEPTVVQNWGQAELIGRPLKKGVVQLIARNKSSLSVDTYTIGNTSPYYQFMLVAGDGQILGSAEVIQYFKYFGTLKSPYFWADGALHDIGDTASGSVGNFQLPPGFGFPMAVKSVSPLTSGDWGLIVTPSQGGLEGASGVGKIVRKGEVAGDFSLIAPEVAIKSIAEPWQRESSRIRIEGIDVAPATGDFRTLQVVRVELTNTSDSKIGGLSRNLEMLVYLADGRVIPSIYVQPLKYQADVLRPGEVGNYAVIIGRFEPIVDAPLVYDEVLYKTFDVKGSVILAMIGGDWAAWRMP